MGFAKYGMTDVELLSKLPGVQWDNTDSGVVVLIGQYQMPMPHLITEGRITKGNQKIPMYLLAQLITHGNGDRKQARGKGLELNLAGRERHCLIN